MKMASLNALILVCLTGMFMACFAAGSGTSELTATNTAHSTLVFSPYKYVRNNMDWNQQQLTIAVTGKPRSLLDVIPPQLSTITLAFATGECGEEAWDGFSGEKFAAATIASLANAGKKYLISTGGQAGAFTCNSDAGFEKFIERYQSRYFLGIDFDIEASQSTQQIEQLIQRVKVAQIAYPSLRFSFTLPTLAVVDKPALGAIGVTVMKAIQVAGLRHYVVNLMTMDYGISSPQACVVAANGRCDMGLSAIQAALNLHIFWGVPFDQIEITPMIGGNDTVDETFSLSDVVTVSRFAKQNQLAGLHFWSIDRDSDCAPGPASADCNTFGASGLFGFTNAFLRHLTTE